MTQEIPDGIALEPVFVVEATYAPDAAERRPRVRAEHLARIVALRDAGVMVEAGAYPDMSGSLLMLRATDAEAALAVVRDDVYMRSGVWVDARVRPFARVARSEEIGA